MLAILCGRRMGYVLIEFFAEYFVCDAVNVVPSTATWTDGESAKLVPFYSVGQLAGHIVVWSPCATVLQRKVFQVDATSSATAFQDFREKSSSGKSFRSPFPPSHFLLFSFLTTDRKRRENDHVPLPSMSRSVCPLFYMQIFAGIRMQLLNLSR